MIKIQKLIAVVGFLLGAAAEDAEPVSLYASKQAGVFNSTEEYYMSDSQYTWIGDTDPQIVTVLSNKTVIELSPLDGIKNENDLTSEFSIYSAFEFWSKKQMRNITKLSNKKIIETNSFYELHSQIILNNIDVTDWATDTLIQFRIGIHVTRTQRDWLIITLKFPGIDEQSNYQEWSCVDAFHQKHIRYDTWDNTQIEVDSYQNCYIFSDSYGISEIKQWKVEAPVKETPEKEDPAQEVPVGEEDTSTVADPPAEAARRMLQEDRTMANFTVHIMRPFYTVDMDGGDVQIENNKYVALQLAAEWDTNLRQTGTTIWLEEPLEQWKLNNAKIKIANLTLMIVLYYMIL